MCDLRQSNRRTTSLWPQWLVPDGRNTHTIAGTLEEDGVLHLVKCKTETAGGDHLEEDVKTKQTTAELVGEEEMELFFWWYNLNNYSQSSLNSSSAMEFYII